MESFGNEDRRLFPLCASSAPWCRISNGDSLSVVEPVAGKVYVGRGDRSSAVATIGCRRIKKEEAVASVLGNRGHRVPLCPVFPPRQIVPGFACSVASLDRFRGHQLPGHQSFRNDALANNLLGQGRPSAWFARLETIPNTPPPTSSCDRKNKSSQILKKYMCLRFCLCNCNLPTWTDPWVINCQDTKAQARMPLQTICLAAADRQHGLRGLPGAA